MDNSVDLFSKLTSSLLIMIVSFLPFKEAARTSILSRQWRDIWRETTTIELNEKMFVTRDETDYEDQRIRFIDFVRQLVANYPATAVQKFAFAFAFSKPGDFLIDDIQNFVTFACSHNVKELELDFSDPSWRSESWEEHDALLELPSSFYQNANLESLKLFSCIFDPIKFTDFGLLKSLSLGWVQLSVNSLKELLVRCPLLESLNLKKCSEMEFFEISMPNLRLKSLVVDKCHLENDLFLVKGPKLQSFKYSGFMGRLDLEDQDEMVEMDLDFAFETEYYEVGPLLYNFLQDFCHIQVLTVCTVLLQTIPTADEPLNLQTLLDVRDLTLKTALHAFEFPGIKFMLKICPFLESLTIDLRPPKIMSGYLAPYAFNPHRFWTSLMVQTCVRRSLKVVNIKNFKGSLNEFQVLRHFISCGRVLQQLNLFIAKEVGENRELYINRAQQILLLKPAAENITITVV